MSQLDCIFGRAERDLYSRGLLLSLAALCVDTPAWLISFAYEPSNENVGSRHTQKVLQGLNFAEKAVFQQF